MLHTHLTYATHLEMPPAVDKEWMAAHMHEHVSLIIHMLHLILLDHCHLRHSLDGHHLHMDKITAYNMDKNLRLVTCRCLYA